MTIGGRSETSDRVHDRLAMYRAMQNSIPGLDAMYQLMSALIDSHSGDRARILIVGAGGGREIEEIANGDTGYQFTAVDPSRPNLDLARLVAANSGPSLDFEFMHGTVDDLSAEARFDVATSLLVMHHLADDGAKLAYLRGIRRRLADGGLLIHADVCFDEMAEFDRLVPAYEAHAKRVGTSFEAIRLEREAIPQLVVASDARTRTLFAEAGLAEPNEVFRALWYRCWISKRNLP